MNQSAPFWDFIASLEDQGTSHPFFSAYTGNTNTNNNNNNRESDNSDNDRGDFPWAWGPRGWGGRFAHRGRPGPPPEDVPPPPPPPAADEDEAAAAGPPPDYEGPDSTPQEKDGGGEGPSSPRGGPHRHHRDRSHHRHGGGPSGHGHGPDAPRRGCHGRRGGWGGGWGGRHRGPPPPPGFGGFPFGGGSPFNPANFADFFSSYLGRDNNNQGGAAASGGAGAGTSGSGEFRPAVDVFDTETAFVVHVSLPGAKKEDVGVNWDAERSELVIGGVITRPGDEEFLKTLALDERTEVGAFERKVRLGSRANPAQVDVDGIGAKLEEGILRIEVPKLDKDYVEIRKVDVE
ncbi:MAG: hypothetical protein Q9165_005579 [Trypethelium subeluteriae]